LTFTFKLLHIKERLLHISQVYLCAPSLHVNTRSEFKYICPIAWIKNDDTKSSDLSGNGIHESLSR